MPTIETIVKRETTRRPSAQRCTYRIHARTRACGGVRCGALGCLATKLLIGIQNVTTERFRFSCFLNLFFPPALCRSPGYVRDYGLAELSFSINVRPTCISISSSSFQRKVIDLSVVSRPCGDCKNPHCFCRTEKTPSDAQNFPLISAFNNVVNTSRKVQDKSLSRPVRC